MLKRYLETVNTQKKMNCSMTKDAELNLNLSLWVQVRFVKRLSYKTVSSMQEKTIYFRLKHKTVVIIYITTYYVPENSKLS